MKLAIYCKSANVQFESFSSDISLARTAGQFESARSMSVTGAQRWEGWNKDPNIPNEWYV